MTPAWPGRDEIAVPARGVARWAAWQPGTLVICGDTDALPAALTIPPAGERPGPLLCGTGWATHPGSQWQQDPPGQWTVPVSRHSPCTQEGKPRP